MVRTHVKICFYCFWGDRSPSPKLLLWKSMFNSNILVSDVQFCFMLWQTKQPQWIPKVILQGTMRGATRLSKGQHPRSVGKIAIFPMHQLAVSSLTKRSSKIKGQFHVLWRALSALNTQKDKIFKIVENTHYFSGLCFHGWALVTG